MNEQNLKSYVKGCEEAVTNGRTGGIASGEAKREKKKMREIVTDLLERKAPDKDITFVEYEMDFISNMAVIASKMVNRAKSGDPRAIKLLLELLGELDSKGNVNVSVNIEETEPYEKGYRAGQKEIFEVLTDTELHDILERMNNKQLQEVTEDKPLIMPNGVIIYGESQLG